MIFFEEGTQDRTTPFEATSPFDLGRTNPTEGFRLLNPRSPFSNSVVKDFSQTLACRALTLEGPNREEHITQLMHLVGWPMSQSPWTSTTSEPYQTGDEEEDLPEAIGIMDLAETPGAMQPRLVPAIPLALFASIADNQDTLLGTVPNDEDGTKPTTPI
jgi:hypothetical protein